MVDNITTTYSEVTKLLTKEDIIRVMETIKLDKYYHSRLQLLKDDHFLFGVMPIKDYRFIAFTGI